MPVDPQIAAILALLEQAGAPSMASVTPEVARARLRTMAVDLRDPATLAAVRSAEDSTIPGPAGPLPVRIYRPEAEGPVPTMLFIHGGGFVLGDIETHDDQARLLCRDVGMVVVSVEYRLAPEHPFPEGFEDCLAAMHWVADNVEQLGGDPARLVVGGDSAGGNLSAAVALACRDGGPRLAAQFLIYPGVDFSETDYASRTENSDGYFLTLEDMLWFAGQYVPEESTRNDPRASPIRADSLAGAPPAVIGTAEFDPLRDEGEAYAKALADAGVEVRLQRYDGMIHGFYGFGAHSPGAAAAVADMNRELRELLS